MKIKQTETLKATAKKIAVEKIEKDKNDLKKQLNEIQKLNEQFKKECTSIFRKIVIKFIVFQCNFLYFVFNKIDTTKNIGVLLGMVLSGAILFFNVLFFENKNIKYTLSYADGKLDIPNFFTLLLMSIPSILLVHFFVLLSTSLGGTAGAVGSIITSGENQIKKRISKN